MKKIMFALTLTVSIGACQKYENKAPVAQSHDIRTSKSVDYEVSNNLMSDSINSFINTKSYLPPKPQPNTPSLLDQLKSNENERKIMRTADLRFKVKNVENATYQIENLTKKYGGFVTSTHLESRIGEQNTTPLSTDSLLEITAYNIENAMLVRVENRYLDTFLLEMSKIYAFLDRRQINASDMTIEYNMNALKAKIRAQSAKRLQNASDTKGTRLNDIATVEQTTVDMNEGAIDHYADNMRKDFDVQYSTINLALYQEAIVQKAVKANTAIAAQTPIWYRLTSALRTGWYLVLDLLVGLVTILPVLILIGGGIWFVRKNSHFVMAFGKK